MATRYGETAGAVAVVLAVIAFLLITRRLAVRVLRQRGGATRS
jgi:hypothetical protein